MRHLSPQHALECLRGHWEIEHRLCRARDVSFPKDRLPGREVAPGLSARDNLALNARADRDLSLLTG
jgi:hypothetical protein